MNIKNIFKKITLFHIVILIISIAISILVVPHIIEDLFGDKVTIGSSKDGVPTERFTSSQLATAQEALKNGITFTDPQNDWYIIAPGTTQPYGRPDNPDTYPLGWTDVKSISIGANGTYLYVKFEFWDEFPFEQPVYNGDAITGVGGKIEQFTFTKADGTEDTADLGAGVDWIADQNSGRIQTILGQSAMISPIGVDEYSETVYERYTGAGLIAGGPGYNYVLSAFPLSLLNLQLGDTVTFALSSETGSTTYHHEAIDFLLSDSRESKEKNSTRYTLGSDTYELIEPY